MKKLKYIPLRNPELVTVGDCILAMQMGYEVVIENGQVVSIRRVK